MIDYKIGNRHNCLTELVAKLKLAGIDKDDASVMLNSFVEAHREDDEDECDWDYIIDAEYLEDVTMTYLLHIKGSKIKAVLRGPAGLSFDFLREQFLAETKTDNAWYPWTDHYENAFVSWLAKRYEITYDIRFEYVQAPGKPQVDDEEDDY